MLAKILGSASELGALLLVALPVAYFYLRLPPGALAPVWLRRALRAALVTLVVVQPLATQGPGPVQLVLGLLAGYLGIRIVALGAARARPRSLGAAARATLDPSDVLVPAPPDPARRLARAAELGVAGAVGCVALLWIGSLVRLWRFSPYLDDLYICLEVGVGSMGMNNLIIAAAAATGRSVVGLQQRPALSASLAELWAVRWNRLVGRNLDRGFFRPLSRRGHPQLGLLAAFAASGVMHLVPVFAATPYAAAVRPAASVALFFALQPPLILAERVLGWHRPPPPGPALTAARIRTAAIFVLLTPLLLGPFADICGVHGRGLP
jgi:hypothetical protein